jgi:hypothetical protein
MSDLKGAVELVAWIGEDEMGSGKVGIKMARVPAGLIPIVAVKDDEHKITRPQVVEHLQHKADQYGKTIRLVRYIPVEEIIILNPRGRG